MELIRVVLADDHAVVRTGLRSVVDACPGISIVGEAQSGAEAIAQAKELQPDIVIMDVSMPEVDGATATERIRRECPGVRVIALTAHDDRGHLTRLLRAGAAGYVLKSSAADELVRAIRAVASGSTYVDPTFAGTLLRKAAYRSSTNPSVITSALSEREEEVLRRVAWGETNSEIGVHLGISPKTVETHKAHIKEKLGLKSRTEMVHYAVQQGWLSSG